MSEPVNATPDFIDARLFVAPQSSVPEQFVPVVQSLREFQASYLRVYSFKEEEVSDAIAVGRR
jgi:hypothetical protein